jgi:hypothetical protein
MRKEIKEWRNEIPGMVWMLIRVVTFVDKNGYIVDGYNEFIDTRTGERV